jgi:hypothetical protein
MSNGSSSSYVGACRKDIPYPSVSSESVPSLIDNLVYALYGTINKSVINRRVVWNIPCDPNNTALINNIPRLAGEGLLCYIIRVLDINTTNFATNLLGGALNSIPYQSAPNTTQFLPAGANGQVLGLLGGSLTWVNAPAALTAGGIAGGLAGNVLYQTAPNISGFVTNGTSGQVLISNGAASPSWSTNIAGNAATSSACTGNSVTATTATTATTALACSGNSATATLATTASAVSAGGVLTAMIGDNQVTPAKLETISGLAAGTYGTATTIPAITIDTKGRVTAVTTNSVSVTAPRIRAVKFAEVNGGNASTVVAYTWTSLLDSQGNLRAAGTGLTGRFGTGFELANSVGGGFFTSQIPFTDSGEAVAKYFTFPNGMIVLSTTGNLYSTGENTYGALGLGDTTNRSVFNKIAISNVAQLSVSQEGNDTSAVHCFAVTTTGALYAWGYNGYGQLGDGTTTNRTAPVLISGGALDGKTITKCFAFGFVGFSFVIDSDRKLYATGYNGQGQLGLGDITNRSSFTQVSLVEADTVCGAGGASATYAAGTSWIVWDGEVYGSGYNLNGEIGDGTILSKSSFTKSLGLTNVQSLTVSNNYANDGTSVAALLNDGTVRVWGRNTAAGQLGINTTVNQLTPTTLAGGFSATQFSKIIMAGYVANCRFYALRTNGLLYSCGAAGAEAGDGINAADLVLQPVRQFNGLTFTDFRVYGNIATQQSVLAITPNGELWVWGYNNALQLGIGTSTGTISTPQRVSLG